MKLLSWMHRKLQKDSTSSVNSTDMGNTCTCFSSQRSIDREDTFRPVKDFKLRQEPQLQCQLLYEESKADTTEGINEESSEIFPGFLTIGTLNLEPITDPPTPSFDMPCENSNEDQREEIKYDLKLINVELEKFIKAEADKESSNGPSNTVILHDKEKEDTSDSNKLKLQAHPLQEYLLGLSTELARPVQTAKKAKKVMQEVFKSTIKVHNRSSAQVERTQQDCHASNNLKHKMLQKPQLSPQKSADSAGWAAGTFSLTKLYKIKEKFHKKIHPEIGTIVRNPKKISKNEINKILKNSTHVNEDSGLSYRSKKMGCWGTQLRREKFHLNSDISVCTNSMTKQKFNSPTNEIRCPASREHWINTDEECKYKHRHGLIS